MNPYPDHYNRAFAFSSILCLHRHSSPLRKTDSHTSGEQYRFTTFRMIHIKIGLGHLCIPTRTTGVLARRQYSPTCLALPFWLRGRMAALAPLLSRYVTPRFHLHYPYRSFPKSLRACSSPLNLLHRSLRPRRCQRRPRVWEQVIPYQSKSTTSFSPSRSTIMRLRVAATSSISRARLWRVDFRVETVITFHPPHRSGRDQFGHPVLQ